MHLTALRLAAARGVRSALSRSSLKGKELAPGSVATFDKNFPAARKSKAWDGGNREQFFKDKYAHVHAKQKSYQQRQNEGKFGRQDQEDRGRSDFKKSRSKSTFAKLKPISHTEYIYGTSAVEAALKNPARSQGHSKLYVLNGIQNVSADIIRMAKELNIPIDRETSRRQLNQLTEDGVHNGYALKTRPLKLTSVESLGPWEVTEQVEESVQAVEEEYTQAVEESAKKAEDPNSTVEALTPKEDESQEEDAIDFLEYEGDFNTTEKVYSINEFGEYDHHIVKKEYNVIAPQIKTNALGIYIDQVTDPHNLGAILRSAHFLGADFAILSELNCAKLSPVAAKSSAGAIDSFKIFTCDAPLKLFEKSVAQGWNIIATVPPQTKVSTAQRVSPRDLPVLGLCNDEFQGGPCLLAVGSESEGLRKSLLQRCTHVVSIPKAVDVSDNDSDVVESLNVSVATALLVSNFLLN